MFTGSLTKAQLQGLFNIITEYSKDIPDFMKYKNILPSLELTWFQCMCVEHALISKGSICSLGTGTGKTAASAAYMLQELRNAQGGIGIFICLPESIEQIQKDYESYLGIPILTFTGENAQLYHLSGVNTKNYPIIIFSTQALYTIEFANWFVNNSSQIQCAVFDEAHMYSQESIINSIITQMCRKLPSKLFLTATPITVSPVQVITLLNMLDPYFIPMGKNLLKPYEIRDPETFEVIDYKKLDELSTAIYPRYISWTRKELGLQGEYVPHVLLVKPTAEQLECSFNDIETVIKGQRNSNQVETFKAICLDLIRAGKRGLVYCNTKKNSEMLNEVLHELNINSRVANGDPKNKKVRQEVLEDFHYNEVSIIITNLTTSLNLNCDFVIFWENTNQAVQMIGRCERGFIVKRLDIYFIFTEGTVEVEQFSKNVYRRCKWLFEALSKDTEVFLKVQKALDNYKEGSNVNK